MTTKLTNYQKEIKSGLLARGIEVVQSGAGKSSFIGKEPMPSSRKDKITALTHAKDQMERSLSLLRAEGYTPYSDVYKHLHRSIDLLRSDTINLQTGAYPFVTVNEG